MEALNAAKTARSAERALQTFLDQFQLKVVVLPLISPDAVMNWDDLTDGDLPILLPFGRLLICEYAKYSPRWVHSSEIKRVVLVKNLRRSGVTQACRTVATTNLQSRTVYHSVECLSGLGALAEKHGLHHEFWHLMAFSAHGGLHDADWVALNDPGFVYGKDVGDPINGWNPDIPKVHPRPGFVTWYALYTEAEDQAETYATMFVNDADYAGLVNWMATDSILKSKVEYMRQFIVSIDPTMTLPYLGKGTQEEVASSPPSRTSAGP
jgi:hypothetical protein